MKKYCPFLQEYCRSDCRFARLLSVGYSSTVTCSLDRVADKLDRIVALLEEKKP